MSREQQASGAPAIRHAGAWPFVTLHSYSHEGRPLLWRSRQNRKGLQRAERGQETARVPFWHTQRYNWLTGLLFAVGALLFMLGAMLSLLPADRAPAPAAIGVIFFLGSLPFTTAGYMQHFQAANAQEFRAGPGGTPARSRLSLIGWHPGNPGWLSTFTQFLGTLAFNLNTFDAIHPPAGWYLQDLTIWTPGMVGSVLFLVSGYLAFIEACHGYWAWKPADLDWRIVFVNLLGCVFFMVAGVLAYVPRGDEPGWIPVAANLNLWLGALGFLAGAAMLMRESEQAERGGSPAVA